MNAFQRQNRVAFVALIVLVFLFAGSLQAATYYVDFDSGVNTNAGTSQAAPWKHAPGDPKATGVPLAVSLLPGDTVSFKGGVVYRGSLSIKASGTGALPIAYKGNGWGAGKAILDGSDVFSTTWTRCTGPQDCGGNPNWQNIWYTTAPANFNIFQPIYEDGEFLWLAQDPNPADPICYDRQQDFRIVPRNDPTITMTRTSITDSRFFTQTDAAYWTGSYALIWCGNDIVVPRSVTSFSPATKTVQFADIGNALYTDRDERYAMVGHVILVDVPGEFGLYGGKLFVWPRGSVAPSNHTYSISQRKVGIDLNGRKYLVVEGFDMRGFHALAGEWNQGGAILSTNINTSQVSIRDNDISRLRAVEGTGAIYIAQGSNIRIERNHIHHCQENRGIIGIGERLYVDNNTVEYVSTGIFFMQCSNGRITGNLVQNIKSSHANGISVYLNSSNILVARNRIIMGGSNVPFTVNETENVFIIGNLMDGMGESWSFRCWDSGGMMKGTNYVLQNTIVRSADKAALSVGSETPPTFVVKNNVIDGGIATNRSYNLYVELQWNQTPRDTPPWYPASGEIVNQNVGSIFVNYPGGDFHLKSGSPAIGAGTDVSSFYPTALFPDYDFSVDLDGKPRPAGAWHLGAYAPPDTAAPSRPTGLVAHPSTQ